MDCFKFFARSMLDTVIAIMSKNIFTPNQLTRDISLYQCNISHFNTQKLTLDLTSKRSEFYLIT